MEATPSAQIAQINNTGRESHSAKAKTILPEDITVAIFCALAIEVVAVKYILDERFEGYPNASGQHNYVYSYGRIGDHNIVIARPHQMGTVKAAQCAATVAQQFPNIRFALMIGTGGGIPSSKFDIRLGDIAVSIPRDGHPGVIEYDHGKYERDGMFVLKGSLNKPPPILISADGSLEEDEEMDESPLSAILEGITNKRGYARPESDDVLFEQTFHHVNEGEDCSGCEASSEKKIMPRKTREEEIKVHRGLILSGGAVVKNPDDRAHLCRSNETAICFEMEAAGIMDQIPCLVVRGICNYADSHKNDEWCHYAAATAAAYGKAILTKVHMSELEQRRSMRAILDNVEQRLEEVGNHVHDLKQGAAETEEAKQRKEILDWFTPANWMSPHYIHSQKREPDSSQWFLHSPMFKQ